MFVFAAVPGPLQNTFKITNMSAISEDEWNKKRYECDSWDFFRGEKALKKIINYRYKLKLNYKQLRSSTLRIHFKAQTAICDWTRK